MGSPGLACPPPSSSTHTSSLPSLPHFLLLTVFMGRGARERPGSRSWEYLLVRGERQAGGSEGGRGEVRESRATSWSLLGGWRRMVEMVLVWRPRARERLEVEAWRRQGAGTSTEEGEVR